MTIVSAVPMGLNVMCLFGAIFWIRTINHLNVLSPPVWSAIFIRDNLGAPNALMGTTLNSFSVFLVTMIGARLVTPVIQRIVNLVMQGIF